MMGTVDRHTMTRPGVRLFVFALCVAVSSCASIRPALPNPGGLPQARVSTSPDDSPQKLRFPPLFVRWRAKGSGTVTEEYRVLPPGWNAYSDGCDVDWCWGSIEMPDGHPIRWASGTVSSGLDGPGAGVIWQRSEERPFLRYGLVRRPNNQEELVVAVAMVVLSTVARSEDDIQRTLHFARSVTSTVSPCRDCVRPAVRK